MNINLIRYGTGMPLVFFHGWGFDSQIWVSLIPHLQHTYELILVDLPGFGLTPMQDWSTFKAELLLVLPLRFHMLGWSLGGLYATRLALEEQERVLSLVNVTSSPRFISESQWPGVDKSILQDFHHKLTRHFKLTVQEFVRLQAKSKAFKWTPEVHPSLEALEHGLEILKQWDLRPALKELHIPVAFLFGRLDPITPASVMNIMKSMYPNFYYALFPKAAHMPFISHREAFIKELMEFIQ